MTRLLLATLAALALTHSAPPCRAAGSCPPGVCLGGDCGAGCVCVTPPGELFGSCWGFERAPGDRPREVPPSAALTSVDAAR